MLPSENDLHIGDFDYEPPIDDSWRTNQDVTFWREAGKKVLNKNTMTIEIQLKETSQALKHENVKNAYQKGSLYCVYVDDVVYKYPLALIWRIKESYK